MSDDDLIRRGDALAIVVRDRVPTNRTGSEFRVVSTQDMLKAIAALPAVTVGPICTWPSCGHTAKGQCLGTSVRAAPEVLALVEAAKPFADIGVGSDPDYQPMIRMDRDAVIALRAALANLRARSDA